MPKSIANGSLPTAGRDAVSATVRWKTLQPLISDESRHRILARATPLVPEHPRSDRGDAVMTAAAGKFPQLSTGCAALPTTALYAAAPLHPDAAVSIRNDGSGLCYPAMTPSLMSSTWIARPSFAPVMARGGTLPRAAYPTRADFQPVRLHVPGAREGHKEVLTSATSRRRRRSRSRATS